MKKYYFILLLVPILLGSTYPVLKYAVSAMSPYTLIAYRFLIASLVMLFITKYFKEKLFEKKEIKYGIILGLLLLGIYLAETVGIQWTNASNAGFISDSTAIFVIIFGFLFFKEKTKPVSLIGVLIVFIGMYLLIFTQGIKVYTGDFLILLAPFFGSLHVLITSRIASKVHIYRILFYQFLVVGLMALILSLILGITLSIPSGEIILLIIYLGLIVTSYRYFAEIFSMRKIKPANVTLIILMTPIWAAIFSYIFLKEILLMQQYLGCFLIFIGLAFAQITNKEDVIAVETG